MFYDAYQKNSSSGAASSKTVIVDIDDVSLEAVGQWPWPRYRVASLIHAVAQMQPAAIGLDIIFAEPDRTALINIQKAFMDDFNLDISLAGVPAALTDNDGYLGSVLSETGVVGAKYFYFDHSSSVEISGSSAFEIIGKTDLLTLHDAPGMLDNTYKIASQLKYAGFLNNQPDNDGMLRKLPLLIQYKGIIYPHLSLATFMRSQGENSATIEEGEYGPVIRVGRHYIPVSKKGFAQLRFNGPSHLYHSVSAVDILNGTVSEDNIRDKVVFVGSSAAGLKDLYHTVFDAQFPGVKTHAVMVENINDGNVIIDPTWGRTTIFALCVLTGIFISLLFIFVHSAFLVFAITTLWIAFMLIGSFIAFEYTGIFLATGTPAAIALILFSIFVITRFAIEKRHSHIWFRQLANARQVTMESMAAVAESRDPETGAHIKRTQHYVKAIADELVQSGFFSETLTPDFIDLLFVSAPLHDLGKVGVPDNILMKAGKLTDEEFVLMKKHAEYGKKIIYSTAEKIEGNNFLMLAGEIASTHHEKWDGSGYPNGLAAEDIPLSGRIMAVADVYDALISKRCYKPPFSHEKACGILREGRGSSFDTVVLDAFFNIEERIKEIAASFSDDNEMVLGDR
ncbi:adenylate cyclase [Mariprofundus aestuarium]|uniref:Adenylate cyclase n=2 Tax=Mariprofundus aestuarium TaxID=1921086 RepID=A0A2K8L2K6_MARES|nr:adenylate cyclase [Mariprofundus aestuarium]